MKRTLLGIVSSVAAILTVSVLFGAAQESSGAIPVCVGADRVLRAVENEEPCPAGAQRFVLASPSVEAELKNQSTARAQPAADPKSPPSDGNTVAAPFTVVDRAGRPILRVQETMASDAKSAAPVVITGGAMDTFSVRVFNRSGVMMAAFGETQDRTGAVAVYDAEGARVADVGGAARSITVFSEKGNSLARLMITGDGRGEVRVVNNEAVLAALSQGASGGGELVLTDAGGTPMVKGFTSPAGVGVVLTGPAGRPGGVMGLPGSLIMGKKQ